MESSAERKLEWHAKNGKFQARVLVPKGASASVELPNGEKHPDEKHPKKKRFMRWWLSTGRTKENELTRLMNWLN